MAGRYIGRSAELRQVDSAVAGALRGTGNLIVVSGPAGVGKTRFCEHSADRARSAGLIVVWGRCWTDGGAPALWPWQSVLAELCGADALLDGTVGVDSVDAQRLSRFMAVVERLAQAPPALLVIDDVHAADPGALMLTRFVARSLHRLPLAMLVTQRPVPTEPLAGEGNPLVLGCFSPAETEAFLAEHGVQPRDAAEVDAVYAVSEGNPLYLRRLVADPSTGLRDGLLNVIDQSLAMLDPTTVQLLTVSSVLGTTVSVTDAAMMIDASHTAVRSALRAAADRGLVQASPDSFTFSHDLVREALSAKLTPNESLDAHARAVRIIRTSVERAAEEHLGRLAHHAMKAAPRSLDDAGDAVVACRAAARSMMRHFAYEQAASLLSAAVGLHDNGNLGPVPSSLVLEWAEAVLSSGRLSEAGQLFSRAGDAAKTEHDWFVFAEAALGLGGMWVNKYRGRADRARVVARLDEALSHVPTSDTVLRTRLQTRQVAEHAYAKCTTDGVLDALAQARATGDQRTLAEALSLTHHALLSPEHGEMRLAVAEELIAVASGAGLEILTLVGICRRTIDLLYLGDPHAERSMADLSRRAELLGCRSVLFLHAVMDVMLRIRAGRFDEAEQQSIACLHLGNEVGDPDALTYHSSQLFTIRWLQGRGAELIDLAEQVANSPTLPDIEFTFHAAFALLAAEAGQHDRARSMLHRIDLARIALSSTWLACMFFAVHAVAELAEAQLARQAYDLLSPFAHLPVVPSMAITCFGSVELSLGVAAMTFGDTDLAVAHFERAVTANLRLANRPLTACARGGLAEALRRRGDRERAIQLFDRAITDATEMGMTSRVAAWSAARSAMSRSLAIHRTGNRWRVVCNEATVMVDDLVGVRYLARLVANPGTEISALDLVGGADDAGNHAVLDEAARAAFTTHARRLATELAEARANADEALVARLEVELDALTGEIERSTGIGGRTRNFAGPAERARTAVRKAITRAIDMIGATDPFVADTLRSAVTTGYQCVYQPAGQE